MIARMWHGRVPTNKAVAYRQFLNQRAISDYRAVQGNLSVHILEQREGAITHFITLTFWADQTSIEGFAGADIDKARYYPEDEEYLLEFEPNVVHYKVVGEA
jgi:heme-degrading monooxygenase HmoA